MIIIISMILWCLLRHRVHSNPLIFICSTIVVSSAIVLFHVSCFCFMPCIVEFASGVFPMPYKLDNHFLFQLITVRRRSQDLIRLRSLKAVISPCVAFATHERRKTEDQLTLVVAAVQFTCASAPLIRSLAALC